MLTQRTNFMLIVAFLGSAGLGIMGCEANVPIHDNMADVHDNEVNADVDVDADFEFDVDSDVDDIEPGASVNVNMESSGVVLVDPGDEPSEEERNRAAHFKIFLDDANSSPLVVTASASASVTIPKNATPGKHKLICRMFKHDGAAFGPTREVSISVKASASVMGGTAGAGPGTGEMM